MALKPQGNNILAGTSLAIAQVQSPGFIAGSSGWIIRQDGSAEFNNIVIRGGTVIGGTALYYSGTPAAGNLVASIAAAAGSDTFGNNYVAGEASYAATFATAVNGGQITWYAGSLSAGWSSVATATAHAVTPQGLVITGSAEVNISNSGGSAGIFLGTAVSPNIVQITGNVSAINSGKFGAPGTVESWNAMSPLQNSWANSGGFVACQYRAVASPPNTVEIIGTLVGTAATAAQFYTLPAHYQPASVQRFPVGGAAGAAGAPELACDTSGNLSLTGIPGLPVADNWFIHGFISLDA